MKIFLAGPWLAILPVTTIATGVAPIDLHTLPSKPVHEMANLTPLILSVSGQPIVVLFDLDAGDVVLPHTAESSLHLLT